MKDYKQWFPTDTDKLVLLNEYLSNVRKLFTIFNDGYETLKDKLEVLKPVIRYFTNLEGLTKPTKSHLQRTLDSLERIMLDHSLEEYSRISHIGTNRVELFFSQVRSKSHYPTLYEYFLYEEASFRELIKSKTKKKGFYQYPWISASQNKNYGKVDLILDEDFIFKFNEELNFELDYRNNRDNSTIHPLEELPTFSEMFKSVANYYYLKRTLSVRQLTCYQDEIKSSDLFQMCEIEEINPIKIEKLKEKAELLGNDFATLHNSTKLNSTVLDGETNYDIYCFDTETTSFHPPDIIELFVFNINTGKSFYLMVNPMKPIPIKSTAVHGYTNIDTNGLYMWDEKSIDFYKWVKETHNNSQDKPIIFLAHNSSFDQRVLVHNSINDKRVLNYIKGIYILDSCKIFKKYIKNNLVTSSTNLDSTSSTTTNPTTIPSLTIINSDLTTSTNDPIS
eukprot:gene6029-7513_t